MISLLPERRQYIPLISLIAALLNLHHFLVGQESPATLAYFLTICFVLSAYAAFYLIFFGIVSLLSPRLPLGLTLAYALAALGRGPERLDPLVEGSLFPLLLTWAALALVLVLAMTSRLVDPLTRSRLPRNLLWPFALFCAGCAFFGLAFLKDAHWLAGVGALLPAAAVFAFFLFLSDRLHVPAALNWIGLAAVLIPALMGLAPHIPLEPPPMEGEGQNFLLITVEGLRFDAITPATMPNTAALAHQGYLFTGMYGVSPAVAPNLQALLVRERNGAAVALAELFPSRFSRRALLPAGREAGVQPALAGFQRMEIQGRRPFPSRMVRAWIPAALFIRPDRAPSEEKVAAECRLLLEGTSRPFVFWLHLDFPAHALSRETVARVRSGERVPPAELRAGYERGLRRLDSALGGLFRWMNGRPWSDKTNILLLGVSGMELGEHGSAGTGHAFYDETTRFPFLWVGPSVAPGTAPTSMSIQDAFPTLVKAFNLAEKPRSFAGMDIASAFRGVFPADRSFFLSGNEAYPPGRAVVSGGFKLIQRPGGGFGLYDLAADPGEQDDRSCADPARVEQMKGLLP